MGAPPLPRNHPRHLDHFSKPMVLGIHNVIVIPNSIEKLLILWLLHLSLLYMHLKWFSMYTPNGYVYIYIYKTTWLFD